MPDQMTVTLRAPAAPTRRTRELVAARLTRVEWALLLDAVMVPDPTSTERRPLDGIVEELCADVRAQVVDGSV